MSTSLYPFSLPHYIYTLLSPFSSLPYLPQTLGLSLLFSYNIRICTHTKEGLRFQGEEQQRFVIPVIYINHPLFMELLKEAEEEFGFDQEGPITIPCHVEEFRNVQGMIEEEKCSHDHQQQQQHHILCFRV
ncbi:hypothetical protein OIU84_002125 [Salix udensis]|uniref:Small auxin up regulated protein n=1 Tax=Salix udensis TaxID=889485 RepID=A0AAD6KA15_9ROSI|nr:hypothetical protein OIU84_002125 [Salix udensis]